MNSHLEFFDFNEQPVRVHIDEHGKPWWFAVDVCRVLEIANPRDALSGLDEDERMTVGNTDGHSGSRGGAQSYNAITLSGLLKLTMRSRKPQAQPFTNWVTKEVLPSIFETGKYEHPAAAPAPLPEPPKALPQAEAAEEVCVMSLTEFTSKCPGMHGLPAVAIKEAARAVRAMALADRIKPVMKTVRGIGEIAHWPTRFLEVCTAPVIEGRRAIGSGGHLREAPEDGRRKMAALRYLAKRGNASYSPGQLRIVAEETGEFDGIFDWQKRGQITVQSLIQRLGKFWARCVSHESYDTEDGRSFSFTDSGSGNSKLYHVTFQSRA